MAIADRHPTVATVCTVKALAVEQLRVTLSKGVTLGTPSEEVDFSLAGALGTGTQL